MGLNLEENTVSWWGHCLSFPGSHLSLSFSFTHVCPFPVLAKPVVRNAERICFAWTQSQGTSCGLASWFAEEGFSELEISGKPGGVRVAKESVRPDLVMTILIVLQGSWVEPPGRDGLSCHKGSGLFESDTCLILPSFLPRRGVTLSFSLEMWSSSVKEKIRLLTNCRCFEKHIQWWTWVCLLAISNISKLRPMKGLYWFILFLMSYYRVLAQNFLAGANKCPSPHNSKTPVSNDSVSLLLDCVNIATESNWSVRSFVLSWCLENLFGAQHLCFPCGFLSIPSSLELSIVLRLLDSEACPLQSCCFVDFLLWALVHLGCSQPQMLWMKAHRWLLGQRLSSHPHILATSGKAVTLKGHPRNQTPGSFQKSCYRVDLKTEKQGKETDSPMFDRYLLKIQVFLNKLAYSEGSSNTYLFLIFGSPDLHFCVVRLLKKLIFAYRDAGSRAVRQLQMFGRFGAASLISSCTFGFHSPNGHSLWPKSLGDEGQFMFTLWRLERPEMIPTSLSSSSKNSLNFKNEKLLKMHDILSSQKEFIHISAMLNVSTVYVGLSYFFTLFTSIQDVDLNIWFLITLDMWELLFIPMVD